MQSSRRGEIHSHVATNDDMSDDESQQENGTKFKHGIPIMHLPKATGVNESIDFNALWENWLSLSKKVCWKDLFPEKLQKVSREEDLDSIDDLMELDVLRMLYKSLIEDETLSAGVGKLPKIALCYIGNNLASSYCERVSSCAKLVMTHDRTVLNDAHLEKVCWLRMNRSFMTYMKVNHKDIAQKWKQEMVSALLE